MGNFGYPEIIIVLVIALLVFGPKKLPELGQGLGRGMRDFKRGLSGEEDEPTPAATATATAAPRVDTPTISPNVPVVPAEPAPTPQSAPVTSEPHQA